MAVFCFRKQGNQTEVEIFFEKSLNENHLGNLVLEESGNRRIIYICICRVREFEMKNVLKKMKQCEL